MNKVFFIGIKGVGMTSLALAMQESGWEVKGSDTDEIFITDEILHKRKVQVVPLDAPIPQVDLIIHSAAYAAPKSGIPSKSLAEALADFVQNRQVIAVAGVGGKTTTTAMLAALFRSANRQVGYYVGTSSISGLAAPGSCGTDPYYVVEADEYAISKTDHRPKFALLSPKILVTTNIIHDHPDIYPTVDDTLLAFTSLVTRLPEGGAWVYNSHDPLTHQIIDLQGESLQAKGVKLLPYGDGDTNLNLGVFGEQNQLDAQAAVLSATQAGLTQPEAVSAIASYHGAGRRQESHGELAGRLLYDDYGHHPAEISITVKSFKSHFPSRRLVLVFESHTYSRTEALLPEFAQAISLADQAFIMPIFESAREKNQPHSISPEKFASMIPGAIALTWDNASKVIWDSTKAGDIILTMGAGFVYKLHAQFKKYANPN